MSPGSYGVKKMEIIVSSIAVIVAAGCFMAIVATDVRENRSNEDVKK
jgi:hypothetical protein